MLPSAAASLTATQWAAHVRTAWTEVSPRLAVSLARRFPASAAIKLELQQLVAQDAGEQAVQVGQHVALQGWSIAVCLQLALLLGDPLACRPLHSLSPPPFPSPTPEPG